MEETKIIDFQQERVQMYQCKKLHIPEDNSTEKETAEEDHSYGRAAGTSTLMFSDSELDPLKKFQWYTKMSPGIRKYHAQGT